MNILGGSLEDKEPEIKVSKEIKKKVKEHLDDTALANREIDIIRGKNLTLKQNRIYFEKMMRKHINSDRDYIMCCSSFEGEGKSRCVNQLLSETVRAKTKEQKLNFLKHNAVYDPTGGELIKLLKKIKPKSVVWVDEAQKLLYKRNYQTAERKDLNILFSTIREKNLIVIFCIPDFYDLDVYFRNWRIKTWIYIPIRGLAIVFKKSNSPFSKDKWEQKKNQKVIEILEETKNDGKLLSKTGIIKALRQLKSYGFEFNFQDWEFPEVKEQYIQYKEWGGLTKPNKEEEIEMKEFEKNKKIAETLFLKGCKVNEIAKIIGRNERTVYDYVKSVREKLKNEKKQKKTKIKDESEISNNNFFKF